MATGRTIDSVETISYGQIVFKETIVSKVSGTNVYNDADNSIKYTKWTLEVDGIVTLDDFSSDSTTTDNSVTQLRKTLNTPGKLLQITNHGTGGVALNSAQDVFQGPKPRTLLIENLGASRSVRVVWTCDFYTTECNSGSGYAGDLGDVTARVTEFSQSRDFTVDERGRWTAVSNGVLEVAAPIDATRRFTDGGAYEAFIKLWAQKISIIRFPWNTETKLTYNLSSDHRRIEFKLVATEIDSESPYPSGVQKITVTHTASSDLESKGFRIWDNIISGQITLYPRVPRIRAWFVYASIFNIRYIQGIQRVSGSWYNKKKGKLYFPRITRLRITEEIFGGNTMSFEMAYVLEVKNLLDLFKLTGLGTNVALNSWREWFASDSLRRNPLGYSLDTTGPGFENLRNETIIDLCNPVTSADADAGETPSNTISFRSITEPECPPKADSWLDYKIQVDHHAARDIVFHDRYENVTPQVAKSRATSIEFRATADSQLEGEVSASSTDTQVRGPAKTHVTIKGYAVRLGGPTDPPNVKSFAGKSVELIDEKVVDRQITSTDCPMHLTMWKKRYRLGKTIQSDQDLYNTLDDALNPIQYQNPSAQSNT